MRVLTLNCWSEGQDFEKRWPLLASELVKIKPDVACLQEVFHRNKASVLQKAVGHSTLVLGEKKSGLALLANYPKIASRSVKFKTKSPNENYSRYALWVRLSVGKTQWDFFVTHLSWRLPETHIRQRQLIELWNWIEEVNGGKRPCVLAGDMNSVASSDEMRFLAGKQWLYLSEDGIARVLKAHQPFRDTFAEVNKTSKHTWSYKNPYTLRADLPERRIDYIWLRPSGKQTVVSSALCFNQPMKKTFASDHFGVVTKVK